MKFCNTRSLLAAAAVIAVPLVAFAQQDAMPTHEETVVIQRPAAAPAGVTPVPGASVTISPPATNPGPTAAGNAVEARFKSETVRTQLEAARTAYNGGDRSGASQHLNEAITQLRGLKLTGDLGERTQLSSAIGRLEQLELFIRTGGGAQPGQFQQAYADTYNALARYSFYKAQGYSNPHTTLMDGSTLRPDGSVVKPDGTVLQPVRVTVTPQNTYVRVGSQQAITPAQLQANQVLVTNTGNLVYPNGQVVRRESSSSKESTTIQRGSAPPPTSALTGSEPAPAGGTQYESKASSSSQQSTSVGGQVISSKSTSGSRNEARYYTGEALANYEAYAREMNQTLTPEVRSRIGELQSWSSQSSTQSSEGIAPDLTQFGTTIEALPQVHSESNSSSQTQSTHREEIVRQ